MTNAIAEQDDGMGGSGTSAETASADRSKRDRQSMILGTDWPDWFADLHAQNRITTHNHDGRHRGGPDYAMVWDRIGARQANFGDRLTLLPSGEIQIDAP